MSVLNLGQAGYYPAQKWDKTSTAACGFPQIPRKTLLGKSFAKDTLRYEELLQ